MTRAASISTATTMYMLEWTIFRQFRLDSLTPMTSHSCSQSTIFIWFIYDLPPDCQYKRKYILIGGIIPGLNKPKHTNSFLFKASIISSHSRRKDYMSGIPTPTSSSYLTSSLYLALHIQLASSISTACQCQVIKVRMAAGSIVLLRDAESQMACTTTLHYWSQRITMSKAALMLTSMFAIFPKRWLLTTRGIYKLFSPPLLSPCTRLTDTRLGSAGPHQENVWKSGWFYLAIHRFVFWVIANSYVIMMDNYILLDNPWLGCWYHN